MIDLGTVRPGSTIRIPFSTFDKDDGSSITMTSYAAADILIYKDGSTTERASTAGYTATTDFDSKTGKHIAVIDLADDTTADFFKAGSEYLVAIDAVTVDAVTTGGWIARFRIGYPGALLDTSIATLASQTSFTLTTGPAEDDALNGLHVIIHDKASAVQLTHAVIEDYTGSTKTVTLRAAPATTFTVAAGDNISVMTEFVKVDVSHYGGTAGTFSAGRPEVNASHAAGTAWNSGAIGASTLASDTIAAAKIATGAITAAKFAAGAIDAAAIATDAIDADAIADNAINAAAIATGAITAAKFAAGAIDAAAIADGAIDAGALAADCITAAKIADGAIDTATFVAGAISNAVVSFDGSELTAIPWNASWDAEVQSEVDDALVARFLDKLVTVNGTADSGSTTTMVDAARTEGDADYWKGQMLLFTSGTISGQCVIITDFNAGTDTFTFAPPTTQAVSTQTYVILPGISVWDDTLAEHLISGSTGSALNAAGSAGDPWATALPGAYGAGTAGRLVGRSLPDIVAGSAGGLLIAGSNAATTFATLTVSGATTLAAVSGTTLTFSGAVAFQSTFAVTTSTSLAALSCTTLTASGAVAFQSTFAVTGTTTLNAFTVSNATTLSGAVSATHASNDIRGVALTSAYDFAKGTVAVTESYNADGSAPTPVQALMGIMQMLMELSFSGTTGTVKKLDGSTTAFTLTINSSTTPTSITRSG